MALKFLLTGFVVFVGVMILYFLIPKNIPRNKIKELENLYNLIAAISIFDMIFSAIFWVWGF